MPRIVALAGLVLLAPLAWADDKADDLAAKLRGLETNVFAAEAAKDKKLGSMAERDIRARIHAAHEREAEAFAKVKTKDDWERFRDARIKALRESLGPLPPLGKDLRLQVARTFEGDGYRRQDIVFESLPGLFVTANLYGPAKPQAKTPGILIVHGFHQPKTQAELQDMGVNWAKLGCFVLVMDQLCHGERRQHPFVDAKSYAGKFNLPRQDYYSRANAGVHLDVIGQSLMGWMVFDTLRGVDLLLSRPGIDKERIIVLGAVAAGGDTAAVAAALDQRITAVVPFNFGGPEPETVYPLPAAGAEKTFPYATGGHWDSTRRLRNSARDGFLPWVVVGAVAPRRLIYAHEFAWDREHDPVWTRLEKIYGLYDAKDNVAFAHGSGTLFGNPEGTGCANIGPIHRQGIYPHLKRWFGIPAPEKEVQDRQPASAMQCLTPALLATLKPKSVFDLAWDQGRDPWLAARRRLAELKPADRRQELRRDWGKLLGAVEPAADPKVSEAKKEQLGEVSIERVALEVEPGIVVPLVLLVPARKADQRLPVVVGVAQHGKQEFLRQRTVNIAELLKGGVAVCLPDVRGTGETRCEGDLRGPPAGSYKGVQANSRGTLLANEHLMLGRTLLGDRLRDLRSVLRYLRGRPDLDAARVALWGDSFALVNGADPPVGDVPWDAEKQPAQAEPLGALLVLFAALWEDSVRAIHLEGGPTSFVTLQVNPFCRLPHDVLVPGALTVGDLHDIVASLAPRPIRLGPLVNSRNRPLDAETLRKSYAPVLEAYQAAGAPGKLVIEGREGTAAWLLMQVTK
jgi:cephalosporin-C deacetylase-like acetyl esterase